MTDSSHCRKCSSPLDASVAGAICPKCMLGAIMESGDGTSGVGYSQTVIKSPSGVASGEPPPDQVRQKLHLVGKQTLYCPKCRKNYNVKNWSPASNVFCPTCSLSLVPPPSDQTIDAHGGQATPRVKSAGEAKEPAGAPFGPYRLLEELGKGGMGVVWKAWDTRLKRVVALKQILPGEKADAGTVGRFVREAQLAAKLRHPNIVGVHDVGEQDGSRYFTTDFIAAQSLDKLMKKPVAARQALEWVKAAADALSYAHEEGVVHRDIKPANFLIDGKGQIFVMDFGLAAEVDLRKEAGAKRARLTQSGQLLGTPQYMSPEQAAGETDTLGPASDQFSLGVVLYELVTGRRPFGGKTVWDLFKAIGQDEPIPPTSLNRRIHRDVETICLKALEKKSEKRYPSMGDFAADLGRHLAGEPIAARPLSGAERLMRKVVRYRAVVIPSAAAVLLAIAFGAWALTGSVQKTKNIRSALAKAQAAEGIAKDAPADESLERTLTAARDAFNATLALDRENREAKAGIGRIQKRLDVLKADRDKAMAAAEERAARERGDRKAQEEANELLELGRKGVDAALRYLYDKNANYNDLVKRVEEGQKPIEQAIAKSPNLALAHYLLGRCWDLRGWDDKAEACWRRAIELRPEFGPAHYELGRLLIVRSFLLLTPGSLEEREGNRPQARRAADEAVTELEAARTGIGFDDPLQRGMGEAMKAFVTGDLESVRRLAQGGIKQFEGQQGVEDFYWLAGRAAPEVGPDQLAAYERAIELRPTHALALFGRGNARSLNGILDGAIQDFTKALKASPRLGAVLVNRGHARCLSGDLDGGIQDLTEALSINPHHADAFMIRGLFRFNKGDLDGAIEDFTAALKLFPLIAEVFYARGSVRRAKRDLDGAIEDFTAALKIDPRHARAFEKRGYARQGKGEFDRAIEDFTEVLKLDPRNAMVLFQRSATRQGTGDLDGAIQDATEALKINPCFIEALAMRGEERAAKGDLGGAIDDYTKALEVAPSDWQFRKDTEDMLRAAQKAKGSAKIDTREMALLVSGNARYFKGDFDGAIQDFTEALKINPRYAQALNRRGIARKAKGDLDGAIQDFTEALKNDPRNAEGFFNRGVAREGKGDLDEAIEDYTEALKIDPGAYVAFYNRGGARRANGDPNGAIQDYTEALKIDHYPDAFVNRGATRHATGDLDGAIQDYTEALKINPRILGAFMNRGTARQTKGDLDGAIQDYTEALKISPRDAGAFNNRGVARQTRGDVDGAIDDYTKALEVAPPDWPSRKQVEEAIRVIRETKGNGK